MSFEDHELYPYDDRHLYRPGSAGRLARIAFDILEIRSPRNIDDEGFSLVVEELGPEELVVMGVRFAQYARRQPVWSIAGEHSRQPFRRLRLEHHVGGFSYLATLSPKQTRSVAEVPWLNMFEQPIRQLHHICFTEFVLGQPVDWTGSGQFAPAEAQVMGRDLDPQALAAKNLLDD